MGKGIRKAKSEQNQTTTTTVSEETNINVGITGSDLAQVLDIVEAGNAAQTAIFAGRVDALAAQPATSFVPEAFRPPNIAFLPSSPAAAAPSGSVVGLSNMGLIVAAVAIVGVLFLVGRRR